MAIFFEIFIYYRGNEEVSSGSVLKYVSNAASEIDKVSG
jgi:hypothetical protein